MKKNTLLFEATLEIYLVTGSNGIIRYHLVHKQPLHSFVKQWVQILKANFQAATEANVRDRDNVLRTAGFYTITAVAAAGIDYNGILLGTGNTPVTISDYHIQTLIPHGITAGKLDHKAMVFDAFQTVGSTASFRTKRQFENKSGGTITVKESGIYIADSTGYHFCIVRDVLAATFDILDTQIAEFRYTFKATV